MSSDRRIPPPAPGRLDPDGIQQSFAWRMRYSVAKDRWTATDFDVYQALALAVRDRLMERWFLTQDTYYREDVKRVYYLSLEFLMGRALKSNLLSLGAEPAYREAMASLGWDLEALYECEWDAGLGNGGLGRLAACFLESAATLQLPFYGYGIRYEYGIFRQRIQDGYQVEAPDNWLRYGNPWEIPRPDVLFPVHFNGRCEHARDADGRLRIRWVDTHEVWAMAFDTPVAGFRNGTVNTLRLWSARSSREFDLTRFNAGDYVSAVEDKTSSENISKVLYPRDDQVAGKQLRLEQQYFFVSATLQDVLRRFRKHVRRDWRELPERVALQLNDTHPVLAIPELMRILVDEQDVPWDDAWEITQKVCGYTNHTVLPEALETWPIELMRGLLPRLVEIVEEIDRRFRAHVRARQPGDEALVERTAVVDADRRVHMARLGVLGSHAVNGVAELHTRLLRTRVLADLHGLFPDRFANRTNGITPRRWLLQANPELAALITDAIGEEWLFDLEALRRLEPFAADAGFRERWSALKRDAKVRLAAHHPDARLDPAALFDCHVKRIHEYKRQLLKLLHALALYRRAMAGEEIAPRAVIFAGKAAPGYAMAKLIIKLIHSAAELIDGEPRARDRLRVAFLPDYSVTTAERVMPACELSEQISTAGTEASGTGNMKAALNGALTIGTLDGANVEIRDEVGEENLFLFGHRAEEVEAMRAGGYSPAPFLEADAELRAAVDVIARGELARRNPGVFDPIAAELEGADRYLLCADYRSYAAAQGLAEEVRLRDELWQRMSILTVARMGRFSSDRSVREYARETWAARAVPAASPD